MTKRFLMILVLGLLLSGCVTYDDFDSMGYQSLANHNRAKLISLEPGMTKKEVLDLMGTRTGHYSYLISNPMRVSLFSIKEDNVTIIYYYTDFSSRQRRDYSGWRTNFKVTSENTTPLVLLNGKLIGWGEESLRRAQDKYDFTIKKDFDIKVE